MLNGDGIEDRMVAFETEPAKLDRFQRTWVAHQQKPGEPASASKALSD